MGYDSTAGLFILVALAHQLLAQSPSHEPCLAHCHPEPSIIWRAFSWTQSYAALAVPLLERACGVMSHDLGSLRLGSATRVNVHF